MLSELHVEVFQSTWEETLGQTRTHGIDSISHQTLDHLTILQEELEEVAVQKDVWTN